MTFTRKEIRTVVLAGTMALSAASALGQTAMPPAHGHGVTAAGQAAPVDKMMWSLTSLDKRIAQLTEDMKMFTGELKLQTMAALLDALVERQTLIDAEMRQMRDHMNGPMNGHRRHAPPASDLAPETLCSPLI
jgi:TolA-binding protein